jgi:hypothetical protein
MNMDDDRGLLAPLRDLEPPGPSTVDVARAVRDGRRRKAAFAAAAAAIVALVAVGLGLMQRQQVPLAASRFDVLTEVFTVGTAGGFTPSTFETGEDRQQAVLVSDKGSATVTVYAAGRFTPAGNPAPDVYGHRARWIGDYELAFEWGPGAWATITVNGYPDGRARAQHIADSVATDTNVPVKLPFTLTKPAWPLTGVRLPAGDRVGDATMIFGSVSVTFSTTGPPHSDHSVTVRDETGNYWVTVDAGTAQALTPAVTHVADTVRPVADPVRRSGWTTLPWR